MQKDFNNNKQKLQRTFGDPRDDSNSDENI
jgi:hypothetical protein